MQRLMLVLSFGGVLLSVAKACTLTLYKLELSTVQTAAWALQQIRHQCCRRRETEARACDVGLTSFFLRRRAGLCSLLPRVSSRGGAAAARRRR